MNLSMPVAIHLAAVVPALVLGAIQLATPKGTPRHKALGWAWIAAMAVAAVSSFWQRLSPDRSPSSLKCHHSQRHHVPRYCQCHR